MFNLNSKQLLFLLVVAVFLTYIGSYNGVLFSIYCIVVALLFRGMPVYLLILISSIQDSPAMGGPWWYVNFCIVAIVMLLMQVRYRHGSQNGRTYRRLNLGSETMALLKGSIFVVAYGIAVSTFAYLQSSYDQDATRPFYLVGPLMLFMILVGVSGARKIQLDTEWKTKLIVTVSVVVANIYFVAAMQLLIGASFYASAGYAAEIDNYIQVVSASQLGFARITGTYGTPNGMSFVVTLMLLFHVLARKGRDRFSLSSVVLYTAFSSAFAVLALSKSSLLLSCIFFLALVFNCRDGISKWLTRILILIAIGIGIYILLDVLVSDTMLSSFRVDGYLSGGSNYRFLAWNAVLQDFSIYQWIFGTGISYWPVFFESSLGLRFSDPHTWLFSYIGAFGVIGLAFFFMLLKALFKGVRVSETVYKKVVLLTMLGILVIKDAFTVQSLFGNTPVTFMIWMLIVMSLSRESTPSSSS